MDMSGLAGLDISGLDMSGMMNMGETAVLPTNNQLAQIYWIFAGGAIVIATIVNLGDKLIHRQR